MAIPAVVCMKSVARSYMWWPGMDQDLEALAKSCAACKLVKSALMATPLHPWLWPEQPWHCIHVDYASPFRGRMFLMIVDAHSKWPESLKWNDIRQCYHHPEGFAAFGLPEQLVLDNGLQFTLNKFSKFMRSN